jgi:hypothetical protein
VFVVLAVIGWKLEVAVLSIFPIARRAVRDDAVPMRVVVPCTTRLALSKVGLVVPSKSDPRCVSVRRADPVDEAIRSGSVPARPTIDSDAIGVEDAIPIFPLDSTVKKEDPDEDATLNGLTVGDACTLKEKVEDVALIPSTVPLSKRVEVPSVVGESHLVAKPNTPPVTPAPPVIPRDEVDTQRVDVPVDHSS